MTFGRCERLSGTPSGTPWGTRPGCWARRKSLASCTLSSTPLGKRSSCWARLALARCRPSGKRPGCWARCHLKLDVGHAVGHAVEHTVGLASRLLGTAQKAWCRAPRRTRCRAGRCAHQLKAWRRARCRARRRARPVGHAVGQAPRLLGACKKLGVGHGVGHAAGAPAAVPGVESLASGTPSGTLLGGPSGKRPGWWARCKKLKR